VLAATGWAEITCTKSGWEKTFTGACFDRKGTPTAANQHACWGLNSRRLPIKPILGFQAPAPKPMIFS